MPVPGNYDRVDLGGDNTSDYVKRSSEGVTGNFEQARPEAGLLPEYGDNLVPKPIRSKQFSSDTNGNPEALLNTTREGMRAHADLNQQYGLTQPIANLGSHPWLRDGCATQDTSEPATAVPNQVRGVPMERSAPNK